MHTTDCGNALGQDGPTCLHTSRLARPESCASRAHGLVPHVARCSRLASPVRRLHLAPHTVLCRTSRLPPGLALHTAEVRPPRHGIELRAGVKLRINECPLGVASR